MYHTTEGKQMRDSVSLCFTKSSHSLKHYGQRYLVLSLLLLNSATCKMLQGFTDITTYI